MFFKAAQDPALAGTITGGVEEMVLRGIALGAVFMGAMTYIGNGPNFMVKAIAEKSGVRMPSFFGYMAYSCVILLPILFVTQYQYLSAEQPKDKAAATAVVAPHSDGHDVASLIIGAHSIPPPLKRDRNAQVDLCTVLLCNYDGTVTSA